jgi:hypothetical protein
MCGLCGFLHEGFFLACMPQGEKSLVNSLYQNISTPLLLSVRLRRTGPLAPYTHFVYTIFTARTICSHARSSVLNALCETQRLSRLPHLNSVLFSFCVQKDGEVGIGSCADRSAFFLSAGGSAVSLSTHQREGEEVFATAFLTFGATSHI